MAKDDASDPSHLSDITRERSGTRPDFSKPLPRQTLGKDLQERLEKEESDMWSSLYDGTAAESTDSSIRYAGYAARIKTVLLSAHRYVAYTSDIGESFRPVAHPYLVKGAYGVSWAYLFGDVGYEGYKAYLRNQRILHPEKYTYVGQDDSAVGRIKSVAKEKPGTAVSADTGSDASESSVTSGKGGSVVPIEDYRAVMAQRAVFQGVASMGLPAFTIHSIVKYAGRAMKDVKNVRLRTWGPIGLGLAAVPALPYMFDQPVEHATEYVFHKAFEMVGGPETVGHRPETGRHALLQVEAKESAQREKEL